ncbi:MAG: hypothetical protein IPH96_17060 [Saprospiraceae bacterium]|nr:hypothetical protein [Saprospiraceae bacterium]
MTDGLLLCTDITGKVHISKQIVNALQFKLDVKDLPIGVYNLRIGSLMQKLEIVR